jgi:hypothetical protein
VHLSAPSMPSHGAAAGAAALMPSDDSVEGESFDLNALPLVAARSRYPTMMQPRDGFPAS